MVELFGRIMKMKILMAVFSVLLLVLSLPATAAQADNSSAPAPEEGVKAGILPDSPLYFFDKFLARISLTLTFDKAAKAEKSLKIANERLLEVKAMALKGKLEHAAKAQQEYSLAVDQAEQAAARIDSHGTPEKATKALQKIAALQNKTESHAQKVSEIKDAILERQGDQMSPEQVARLEQVFEQVKEKAAEMELKLGSKRDKVEIKHRVLANLTPEQSEAVEQVIDEKAGLTKGREERAKHETTKAQEAGSKAKIATKEAGVGKESLPDKLPDSQLKATTKNFKD